MPGLGTGRILSTYMRPNFRQLYPDKVEAFKQHYNARKLSLNMWHCGTTKAKRGYLTKILVRVKGNHFTAMIPTEKDGTISQLNMAERLLDTEDGDRQLHNRNVLIDCSVDAGQVHDPKNLGKVYWWWLYPNETDVKFIDDKQTKIVELIGQGAGQGGGGGKGRRIRALIVGGTMGDREKIADHLKRNFTIKEKTILNNCLIEIVGNNRSYAGCFQGHSDAKGNIIGTPKIVVTKSHVDAANVVVHEAIHALREFDKSRDPRLKAVAHYWGRDADLEESLTDAETTAREKPFSRAEKYTAGYYHYIKIPNKTSKDMCIEDRITFTGAIEKGQKGKRVQKTVVKKYPMTNISKLKIKGQCEAIDSFYEVSRADPAGGSGRLKTTLHLFNPSGNDATDALTDRRLKSETDGEVIQFHDGKAETIQKGRRPRNTENFRRPKGNISKPKRKTCKRFGCYRVRGGGLSKN